MAKNPGIKGNDIILSFEISPNPIMKVFSKTATKLKRI